MERFWLHCHDWNFLLTKTRIVVPRLTFVVELQVLLSFLTAILVLLVWAFFSFIPDLLGMRLGCALIGLYLTHLLSMGSLGVVSTTDGRNQSLIGVRIRPETWSWKVSLPEQPSCSSYQKCGCHSIWCKLFSYIWVYAWACHSSTTRSTYIMAKMLSYLR